jgi:ribosomal protein L37E
MARESCRECGEMRYLLSSGFCAACGQIQQRQQERAERWARIERAAVAILAVGHCVGHGGAIDKARELIDEIDKRRAAEEAGNG